MDDEYITQIRRGVQFVDRWRWWLVVYFVGFMSCILLLTLSATWQWFANILHLGPKLTDISVFSGFIGGWMMGCGLGAFFGIHIMFIFPLLFTPMRTERMLLQYVDQAPLVSRDVASKDMNR
ncbi:hypothetical protein GC163_15590 [bacterium]|nr:hypothetical protein [bacterium]